MCSHSGMKVDAACLRSLCGPPYNFFLEVNLIWGGKKNLRSNSRTWHLNIATPTAAKNLILRPLYPSDPFKCDSLNTWFSGFFPQVPAWLMSLFLNLRYAVQPADFPSNCALWASPCLGALSPSPLIVSTFWPLLPNLSGQNLRKLYVLPARLNLLSFSPSWPAPPNWDDLILGPCLYQPIP